MSDRTQSDGLDEGVSEVPTQIRRSYYAPTNFIIAAYNAHQVIVIFGGPAGTRTQDQRIMSPLL